MRVEDITDTELKNFCEWYKNHFAEVEVYKCVFVVSMSGHFHTIPRKAKKLLERCKKLNLVEVKRNMVCLM